MLKTKTIPLALAFACVALASIASAVQYDCLKDVPAGTNWTDISECPMNKDGGCCKEGDELSQTVGFLLYFLIGWTGAGMFYYGYAGLGAALIVMCCGGFCMLIIAQVAFGVSIGMSAGGETQGGVMALAGCCCLLLPLLSIIAVAVWNVVNWIMVVTKGLMPEDDAVQYDCLKDVPAGTNWTDISECPMNKDGGCCKEGDELSQTVGFLLYFLIGWTGAGMFYYGYAGLGAALIVMCCGGFCMLIIAQVAFGVSIGMSGGDSEGSTALLGCCCMLLPLLSILAVAVWNFVNWIMVITKGLMPEDECPLDCNL
eukprot:g1917.t1